MMFKKILVANRGEIALRVIRTCKEMGVKTVAVYSTADAESLHVKFADEAVCIGPAASSESYLKISNIIAAAEITNADAIHPGYGFLSENARFSKICSEHDIKFIGASPEMIDRMGDKANAKATMKSAGVPCVPGSDGVIETFSECKKVALETGYPVMLKASAGGGGKGMRAVWKPDDLKDAWDSARQESKAAFGNDDMYMEKLIEEPRHIEIQIVGDSTGKACHLSERDCSVQRRHQKLTEETPSPFMTDELRHKMGEAAVKAAEFIKYEGAGTVEFLLDSDNNFYFLEMNTRLQVEHPITEYITGVDLVAEQIKVARGEKLSFTQDDLKIKGHAVELRIYAEDPLNDFLPSIGILETYIRPTGEGVRLDDGYEQGMEIPIHYDPMVAKLITYADTRTAAIQKMKLAIADFKIVGLETTLPFGKFVMENEQFISGDIDTHFVKKYYSPEALLKGQNAEEALAA